MTRVSAGQDRYWETTADVGWDGCQPQLEWFPAQRAVACSLQVPCSVPWFRELGFVSLPYMALSAFLLVGLLVVLGHRAGATRPDEPTTRDTDEPTTRDTDEPTRPAHDAREDVRP